jgi:hypothetical protein
MSKGFAKENKPEVQATENANRNTEESYRDLSKGKTLLKTNR